MRLNLSDDDLSDLFNPALTEGRGGFQNIFLMIQKQVNRNNKTVDLNEEQIEKIRKNFARYGNGGWQDCLFYVFKDSILKDLSGKYVPGKPRFYKK